MPKKYELKEELTFESEGRAAPLDADRKSSVPDLTAKLFAIMKKELENFTIRDLLLCCSGSLFIGFFFGAIIF